LYIPRCLDYQQRGNLRTQGPKLRRAGVGIPQQGENMIRQGVFENMQ
jgi:hypothetical protein